LRVIEFLRGDTRTGKAFCPCHPDGSKPSLSISNGNKHPTVIHCFGKESRKHDLEVIAYLKRKGVWPSSSKLSGDLASVAAEEKRTPEERLNYAGDIWDHLTHQEEKCKVARLLLQDYFRNRKLKVPSLALVSMPYSLLPEDNPIVSETPAVVLPVVDRHGEFQGIHVTKLSPDLQTKLVPDDPDYPVRQTYGLLKGNFVELQELDYTKPLKKLLIGEGVETALSAKKLTEGVPAIATGGKGFFKHVEPPEAEEYILLIDADADGASRADAGVLAQRLSERGFKVRLAMPEKPAGGKDGYDWNDALVGIEAAGMEALYRDQILQAPVFTTETMTKNEKYQKGIRELSKLKSRERDEKRKALTKEYPGLRTKTIDEDVEAVRREEAEAEAEPEASVEECLAELAESARDIIECENVLEMYAKDIAHDIAGERNNLMLLYLICTSRLFRKPMSAVLGGPSSAGKSEIREHVLHYFPDEEVLSFTLLSERSLLYEERDFEHKILSMGEVVDAEQMRIQDYLLRELISSGKLRYPVTVPQKSGPAKTITIEKNGPVTFLVTSTKAKLNPENETRLVRLETDESEEQTKQVVDKIAVLHGLNRMETNPELFRPWQDYQRWLALGETRVKIPYARVLGRMLGSYRSPRMRRDFNQLLSCIKANALLHRHHCERDKSGCLLADIDNDYATVRELMAEFMAEAAEVRARKRIRETVEIVGELTTGPRSANATVPLVATKLRVSETTARRRLKQAVEAGYIFNAEQLDNRPARYELIPNRPEEPDYEVLPTVKELRMAWKQHKNRNATKAKLKSEKKEGSKSEKR
jgi:hypothetical protein